MDLLERYLAAVRRDLPAKDADDIIAELRDVLLARAEDRAEALGRSLAKPDWEELLRDFGHPLTVAARYRQQQWLIGPELYPFYLHFLKMIGGIVAAVVVGIAIFRAMLDGGSAGGMVTGLLASLWSAIAITIGSVTIVFVLIERYGGVEKHFRHWQPAELPELPDLGKRQGPWESAFEVGLGIVFLLWWVGMIHFPIPSGNEQFRLEPAPVWMQFYWPILALAAVRLVHNLIQWLRPRWSAVRWLLGAGTAVAGLVLAVAIYQAGHWANVVPLGMPPAQAADLETSLNLALRIAIVAVTVIWTLQSLGELYRLARNKLRAG